MRLALYLWVMIGFLSLLAMLFFLPISQVHATEQHALIETTMASSPMQHGLWSQLVALWHIPKIAYLLVLIGLTGLIFEITQPGLMLPGLLGLALIILGVTTLIQSPLHWIGLALAILAIVILILEAWYKKGYLGSIISAILFIASSYYLLEGFHLSSDFSWIVVLALALLAFLFWGWLIRLGLKSQRKPSVSGAESWAGKSVTIQQQAGQLKVKHDGTFWLIDTPEQFKAGDRVKIIGIKGTTLQVKK